MTNESILKKTLDLLKLETIDRDNCTWTGKNIGFGRIFGGQVMAQCLIAAHRTIESKHSAHSFHSYFLRPGKMDKPITYTVDRIRDGKSFSTRNVKAIQDAEAIFNCSVSFQKKEKGLEAQVKMPDVPGPESLISEYENRKIISRKLRIKKEDMPMFFKQREIEIRTVEPQDYFNQKRVAPYKHVWIKPEGKLPKTEIIQQAFLLYISDMGLLGTANNSVGLNFLTKNLQNASLDHAMWFHQSIDLNEWFLHAMDSPITKNNRGFSRGLIFSRNGKLIASCSQEGLIRLWPDKKTNNL